MSDWSKVGAVLGKVAPLIGGLLGGPAGAAAGTLVSSVLGVEDTPEAVSTALSSDPQAMAKVMEAEITQKTRLAEIALQEKQMIVNSDLEHREITTKDREGARGRDLDLKKAGYKNDRADIMIGVAFVAFCFLCFLIYKDDQMPAGVLAIFNMSIGALLKMLGDAFAFEFGSSRGSKEKDNKSKTVEALIAKFGGKK